MKNRLPMAAIVAGALFMSVKAMSDAPPGVGAAELERGPCFGTIVVGPPGDFFPFLDGIHGVLNVQLGDAKETVANSANGNRNLTCHGDITWGDVIIGQDIVGGAVASGIVVDRADACDAIVTFGLPNPCRGEGEKSAIILGPEFQGAPCNIGDLSTFNWKSVFNTGGYMLTCHGKE